MPPPDRKTPLDERLDEVEALRNLNDRSWSLKAGLSEGYLATQRVRAAEDPGFVLPEKNGAKLAAVAQVNLAWLRFGTGSREGAFPVEDTAATTPRMDVVAFLGQSIGKLYAAGDLLGARAALSALAQILGVVVVAPSEEREFNVDAENESGQRRKLAVGAADDTTDDSPTVQRTRPRRG